MIVNFLSSLILCSCVNCKSSYVGGNKVSYIIAIISQSRKARYSEHDEA